MNPSLSVLHPVWIPTCPATRRRSPHRRRTACRQLRRWPRTATRGRWASLRGWARHTGAPMWHYSPPRWSTQAADRSTRHVERPESETATEEDLLFFLKPDWDLKPAVVNVTHLINTGAEYRHSEVETANINPHGGCTVQRLTDNLQPQR